MGSEKICQCFGFCRQRDLAGDALALAANHGGEVDAAGVFDQDVERGGAAWNAGSSDGRGETAIERADEVPST